MDENRDEKGRFKGGKSGNPGGRPKRPEILKNINEETIPQLIEMANDPYTKQDLRAKILMWLTEMDLGKPGQKVDVAGETKSTIEVELIGELAEWAQ